MAKNETKVEKIELTMDEQDVVYVALQALFNSIESIEKKAKTLKASKAEKGAMSDAVTIRALMNKFLTPVREKLNEEEADEEEED